MCDLLHEPDRTIRLCTVKVRTHVLYRSLVIFDLSMIFGLLYDHLFVAYLSLISLFINLLIDYFIESLSVYPPTYLLIYYLFIYFR